MTPLNFIGIDLNTVGHTVVIAHPDTGRVWKFGKQARHVYMKYRRIEKALRRQGKRELAEDTVHRRERILKVLAHKVSRGIVDIALETGSSIKIEKGIIGKRTRIQDVRDFSQGDMDTKFFHWLLNGVTYKSRRSGVPIDYVLSDRSSQLCSRCGELGIRKGKVFICPACGHFDHSDSNAAFNISMR